MENLWKYHLFQIKSRVGEIVIQPDLYIWLVLIDEVFMGNAHWGDVVSTRVGSDGSRSLLCFFVT